MMNKPILYLLVCVLPLVVLGSCAEPGSNATESEVSFAAERNYKTYCNPIDIDSSYMSHYRARNNVSYRSGADPAIVNFKGKYYLFVTRSHGYWVSDDMSNWKFIRPQSWYFNGCNAPAAAVKDGKIILLGLAHRSFGQTPTARCYIIHVSSSTPSMW